MNKPLLPLVCLASMLGIGIGVKPAAAVLPNSLITLGSTGEMTVVLPYAATLGKVTMPPGEYSIEIEYLEDVPSDMVVVRTASGHFVAADYASPVWNQDVQMKPKEQPNQGQVDLRRVGERWAIDKIWFDDSTGFNLD